MKQDKSFFNKLNLCILGSSLCLGVTAIAAAEPTNTERTVASTTSVILPGPDAIPLSCTSEKKSNQPTLHVSLMFERGADQALIHRDILNPRSKAAKPMADLEAQILHPTDDTYLFVNKKNEFALFLSSGKSMGERPSSGYLVMTGGDGGASHTLTCKLQKRQAIW